MPRRPGRPSILERPEILAALVQAYELFLSDVAACAHAGISTTTLYRLNAQGLEEYEAAVVEADRHGIDADLLVPPEGSAWEFQAALARAKERGKLNAHAIVVQQAQAGRPNALLRLLEARFPGEYGKGGPAADAQAARARPRERVAAIRARLRERRLVEAATPPHGDDRGPLEGEGDG